MWEIWRRANEKDSVAVDEARNGFGGDGVRRRRTGDQMDFNSKVGTCFMEGRMPCFGYNPIVVSVKPEG